MLTYIAMGQKRDRHKTSIRKLGILFFPLSVKKKIQEGLLGLRFQREDQGPFGNQQELINQMEGDCGPTEKREITNLLILNVDLASSTGHFKINLPDIF